MLSYQMLWPTSWARSSEVLLLVMLVSSGLVHVRSSRAARAALFTSSAAILRDALSVPSAFERRREPGVDDRERLCVADRARADAEHVGVVVRARQRAPSRRSTRRRRARRESCWRRCRRRGPCRTPAARSVPGVVTHRASRPPPPSRGSRSRRDVVGAQVLDLVPPPHADAPPAAGGARIRRGRCQRITCSLRADFVLLMPHADVTLIPHIRSARGRRTRKTMKAAKVAVTPRPPDHGCNRQNGFRIRPIKKGPTKPPRQPVELMSPIAAAPVAPDTNQRGSAQNAGMKP